ncbi:hypothetical protein P9D57_17665 [Bacillus sonorensis]|uniref:hypothetical protein n=1 Tax=Bacillus sonorensis TaxID=119858 RepID=UPI002DBB9DD4|nr:hypothetical protein [Bacillus sonorensis]MEC1440519.1 hypothetical protein [Bacillus sonorensis]
MQKDIKECLFAYFREQTDKGARLVSSVPPERIRISKAKRAVYFIGALAVSFGVLGGCKNVDNQADECVSKNQEFEKISYNHNYKKAEIFKTGENEKGQFYYDPNTEYEPTVFISWDKVDTWGLKNVEKGGKVIAIYDESGWELLNAMQVVE